MQSFAGFPPWLIVYSFGVLFFVFITFLRMLNIENCKKYSLGFNYVQKLEFVTFFINQEKGTNK